MLSSIKSAINSVTGADDTNSTTATSASNSTGAATATAHNNPQAAHKVDGPHTTEDITPVTTFVAPAAKPVITTTAPSEQFQQLTVNSSTASTVDNSPITSTLQQPHSVDTNVPSPQSHKHYFPSNDMDHSPKDDDHHHDIPDSPTDKEIDDHHAAAASGTPTSISQADTVDHIDYELSADLQHKIDEVEPQIKELRRMLKDGGYADKHKDSYYLQQALTSDEFAYRFIVARNKNPERSCRMLKQAIDYREAHKIDQILERPLPDAVGIMEIAQQSLHGYDKHGRPVMIERVGSQAAKDLYNKYGFEGRAMFHQWFMEYCMRHVMPAASKRAGKAITQVVIIVDMQGLHFGQVFKTNYQFVKYVAKVNSLLYPEYLATTFCINCPRIFSVCWNVVKGWIDNKTRQKIAIIHGKGVQEVTQMISADQYPKLFGGSCNCKACTTGDGSKLQLSPISQGFVEFVTKVNAEHKGEKPAFGGQLSADILDRAQSTN